MDFPHSDIRRFLNDSIPSRFNNLSPAEFTSLMAFVFRTDGYEVEEIVKKGETAGDLIAKKKNTTLVIKALRLPPDHHVKINDIQQAAAARVYFEVDQSWIITTSSFTEEAKAEADALDIELWDWDAFYKALTQLFFEGKSHFDFIESHPPHASENSVLPDLRLKAKWQPEEGIGSEWYNLDLTISNHSDHHIYIHLDLPALIDPKKNQITAEQWAENEFVAGMIYSGASVRTNALFKASRLGERPPGGRVMLTCHERTEPPSTYHLAARLKGEACFIVTYFYGRQSEEYLLMTYFRDHVLSASFAGRSFISVYYTLSPWLVRIMKHVPIMALPVQFLIKKIINHIRYKNV